jgi:putative oxidoreductase
MNILFSSTPYAQPAAIGIARIILGSFLIFHGKEVFDGELMSGYAKWDSFKNFSSPALVTYTGKAMELLAGILLVLGLFTRPACLVVMATFIYITFFVGKGKFWYDDQHPFMFVLVSAILFFTGPGKWSLDNKLFKPPLVNKS